MAIFRVAPFGALGCLASGFIMSTIFSCVPNFANYYHFSVAKIMQVTILGGCLLQLPVGK